MKPPAPVDPARWLALSPLLDELMDLDEAAQVARLDELRATDPALANELAGLMGRLDRLEDEGFLDAPAIAPPVELAGQTVGAYTLERELGAGGMGSVWLARRTDGRYEGRVAIKFLQAGLFGGGNATRFQREGDILARLDHPHIARLLDAGVGAEHGQPYLVLEYIDGVTLDRYCDQEKLDVRSRLRLFLDVLDAVAHAHNRLILHRDLKPSNILVTRAGQVKLLDFGIAKLLDDASSASGELTQHAGNAFTPQYAAPEQMQGGDVTTATDVYALGVLLYLLLSGRFPVEARTQTRLDQMRATVEQAPRTLSTTVARDGGPDAARRARPLRGDLDTIVAKALKKQPTERYANAAALADDLRRHLADEPISARPDGLAYLTAKFLRRNALAVAAGTLASLGLLIGAGIAMKEAREARQQQEQAEGLIEFMLGDLKQRLSQVGRLDVLDEVGVKAIDYYDRQDPRRLNASSLGRRAKAEHHLGDIAWRRGRRQEAAAMFERAASGTGAQLSLDPDNPERVFEHAQSEYWVGLVAYRSGDRQATERHWNEYLRLAQHLSRLEPGRLRSQVETAYAEQNLGVLYRDWRRRDDAARAFEASAAAWRLVVQQDPAQTINLASSRGFLANIRDASGDYPAAIALQLEKLELVKQVPRAETDRNALYLRANGWHEIARIEMLRGDTAAAITAVRRSAADFDRLVEADADNLDWLAQAVGARLQMMDILVVTDHADQARAMLHGVRKDFERLVADQKKARVDWSVTLRGWMLRVQASVAEASHLAVETTRELERFLDAQEQRRADVVAADRQMRSVATAAIALGDLLVAAGRREEARTRWAQGLALVREGGDDTDPAVVSLATQAQLRLGDLSAARAGFDMLKASAYRHPVYADMERQLAAATRAASPPREGRQ